MTLECRFWSRSIPEVMPATQSFSVDVRRCRLQNSESIMSHIDSATRSDPTGAKSPARPSLLAAGSSARAERNSETVSILSSLATLEGETASHSAGSRHTRIALGLLALVAILAAGMWAAYMHSGRDQPADNRSDSIVMPQRGAAQSDAIAAVASAAAPPLIAPAPSQPAVIEDMGPDVIAQPANPLLALAATKSGPTIDAHKTESAATMRKGSDTTVAVAQAGPAPRARSQPRSSSEASAAAGAKSPQRAPAKHAEARAQTRANTPPRPSRDGDVALIAALLAHAENHPASGGERAKSVKAAAQPKQGADNQSATKVAASNPLDAPSPAQPAEPTTAERLLRCQSLNFFASKLCRWRTCFGLDGKDEACSGPAS